ncbi:DUF3800 domain-containing protein [Paenibacillus sp. 1781tsa1]|uniref:DUF3800 domain-containing protein n=1 Tax=Paenibacillus sp. 1781tsa1 TaxID=2953810 RepID=UPI0020A1D859|nr:DUF3800 domain-containing protein [Paenibacillus sp. 1781tsa1]MCP1185105.1 DUF3800 domain-containing protein [Paenibacillus sp. 1781tsa1]
MILNFDESGNLGTGGRYFIIAAICVKDNISPLKNVIKKAVLKTKETFPNYSDVNEIKASHSTQIIKDYFLNKIVSKDIEIKYIVADKLHVKKALLQDENLLYNYMLQILISPIAQNKSTKDLFINLDQRSIKVNSLNSFSEYIKLELIYKKDLNINIDVKYYESQNSYAIQAADFVANAIYSKYEKNEDYFYNIIKPKITNIELFPRGSFGTDKVVHFNAR